MDLQISVFLLFVLFTAGHSLSCSECSGLMGSCDDSDVITCPSGFSKCMSITTVSKVGETISKVTVKNCTVACESGSVSVGLAQASYSCCDTDLCNARDAPDPSTNTPNGKTCYYCDGQNCSNTVSCSGSEDHCITIRANVSESLILKGCVSKSVCNALASVNSVNDISCCEGNLCNSVNSVSQDVTQSTAHSANGAESISQSFLFLCCSLLSFILLH